MSIKNIIDIGAHNGTTKSESKKYLNRDGYQVYHIEPNPYLQEDLNKLDSIKIDKAISDFLGTAKFYYDKRGFVNREKGSKKHLKKGMRGSLEKDEKHINEFLSEDFTEVEVITLDELIKSLNIESIYLLKIDTEGTDYKILKKYSWTIKPNIIKTEDYFVTNEDKYKLLENNGYKLKNQNLKECNSTWTLIQ